MLLRRFPQNPILTPALDASLGTNINGPSLIRVPDWIEAPLGRYYLYFSHHKGESIRLAYADRLEGPWRIHAPGALRLEQTACQDHIASPDVHVDEAERRIRMYFHGVCTPEQAGDETVLKQFPILGTQRSFVALSPDGLHFTAQSEVLGASYFRVFRWQGAFYALGMPGVFYRSADGLHNFTPGPVLFSENMRHSAVALDGHILTVYYSNAGDCPERILKAQIDLRPDWLSWQASAPQEVLAPEMDYEGASQPHLPSERGWAPEPAWQLRDPCIFREAGRKYLLYAVAGEQGIAIAEINPPAVS